MGVPTKEELEQALSEAARMREHGEDPHHLAKVVLNHNYRIEQLETEQAHLQAAIGEAGFYQQSHEQVNVVLDRLQAVEEELEDCYGRWEALES